MRGRQASPAAAGNWHDAGMPPWSLTNFPSRISKMFSKPTKSATKRETGWL